MAKFIYFYTFCLLLFGSGCRLVEVSLATAKNVTLTDRGQNLGRNKTSVKYDDDRNWQDSKAFQFTRL